MGSVDIGVGHDNDPVVTELIYLKVILADPATEGGNDIPNLLAGEHLVKPRLFNVEYLPSDRQDRLILPIPPLFRGTSS